MNTFIITMQYNESLLLPRFLEHYSGFLGARNIYVIDHGSTLAAPASLAADGRYNRVYVPRDRPFSEVSRTRLIANFASGLLEYYDAGIYADCDELIDLGSLDALDLDRSPVAYVAGFDVFYRQTPRGRRLHGLPNAFECKPLIFTRVPNWLLGFHGSEHAPGELVLPMAHVKYLFAEESIRRLSERASVYGAMDGDERDHGIASHWKAGSAEYENFRQAVDSCAQANVDVVKFAPLDPGSFFVSEEVQGGRVFRPGRRGYNTGFVFDLSDHFPALLGE